MTREELIALRKSLGISQDKMAKILGYTRFHYHRIERGVRSMPKNIVFLIQDYVGAYLIDRREKLSIEIGKTALFLEKIKNLS